MHNKYFAEIFCVSNGNGGLTAIKRFYGFGSKQAFDFSCAIIDEKHYTNSISV